MITTTAFLVTIIVALSLTCTTISAASEGYNNYIVDAITKRQPDPCQKLGAECIPEVMCSNKITSSSEAVEYCQNRRPNQRIVCCPMGFISL